LTRHRVIFPGSYPPSIFTAAAFNIRVRDGIGVVPLRHRHRENLENLNILFPIKLKPAFSLLTEFFSALNITIAAFIYLSSPFAKFFQISFSGQFWANSHQSSLKKNVGIRNNYLSPIPLVKV
jgi:hypothetical protein